MIITKLVLLLSVGHAIAAQAPMYKPVPNPIVEMFPSNQMHFPGPKSDASSTLIWINGLAHFFYNYWHDGDKRTYSALATGRDMFNLTVERYLEIGDDSGVTHRWFESILKGDNGALYAFYHSEEKNPCSFYYKTPEIGMAKSTDNGRTWKNLGIIIKVADDQNDCNALNGFFSNGAGDFSAIYDRQKKFVYITYTNYPMGNQIGEQGITFARLSAKDMDAPVGKTWIWYNGGFTEPGIDGLATSRFKPWTDFLAPNPDGFWGPSVHYNTHINKYVMLVTRTKDGDFTRLPFPTEGIYISTNSDIADPAGWTTPLKIVDGGHWYPQFYGLNSQIQETSDEMGEWARFAMENNSHFIVRFKTASP